MESAFDKFSVLWKILNMAYGEFFLDLEACVRHLFN